MKYFVIITCSIYIAIIANLSLLRYLIDIRYWDGLSIVPILLLSYIFLGLYSNISIWYKLSDSTKYGFYISIIGTFITLILNFFLIPIYSYYGAACSSLITYFIMTLVSYFMGKTIYNIPYDLKSNIYYLTIALLITFIIGYIFNFNIFIGNVFLLLYTFYVYRKEKQFIKKIIFD
ncbi:MAG: polysaccharide biosynthesis C-terminal domain-containing protein [Bacteroides sp.]|nr:MAG: polysaccharide biosynthesis C-terminal domain-containing protein [Bacteroides sp.]